MHVKRWVLCIWTVTCDFQQCSILKWIDSDEPLQPPFKLRNSNSCSVSSLTVIRLATAHQTALIRLRVCTGWSVPLLVAHTHQIISRPKQICARLAWASAQFHKDLKWSFWVAHVHVLLRVTLWVYVISNIICSQGQAKIGLSNTVCSGSSPAVPIY